MLLKEMANATKITYIGWGFFLLFSPHREAESDMLASCLSVILLLGVPRRTKVQFSSPHQNQQGLGGSRYPAVLSAAEKREPLKELITPIPLAGAAEIWYFTESSLEVNRVWKSMSDVRRPFLSWVIPVPSPWGSLVSIRSRCMIARSKPLEALRPLRDICWKCATR